MAIKDLDEVGINYIKNEKTLRNWNKEFCCNETFIVPFSKSMREPKLFSFFPKARNKVVRYCNKQISVGSLSCESLAAEVSKNIIPVCYKELEDEAGSDRNNLPELDELFVMMGLKTFSVSTAWRMMQYLGYKYCETRRGYYTDGHEREDVVKDRNKRFLKDYFLYEIRTLRWVQVAEADAQKMGVGRKEFPKKWILQI